MTEERVEFRLTTTTIKKMNKKAKKYGQLLFNRSGHGTDLPNLWASSHNPKERVNLRGYRREEKLAFWKLNLKKPWGNKRKCKCRVSSLP